VSHVRKQVRDAAKVALGSLAVFNGVFTTTRHKVQPDQLPAVLIRTPSESVTSLMDDRKEREITLQIEIVGGSERTEDDLDALCIAVEKALDGQDFDNLVVDCDHVSTDIEFTRDDEVQIGSALLSFTVELHTDTGDPETSV
jgi:Protein of unknown function (DUF3168)